MQLKLNFACQILREGGGIFSDERLIVMQRKISTHKQLAEAAQYCIVKDSSSSMAAWCNETARESCIILDMKTAGNVTAPNNIPDEAPGLVLNWEREVEESARMSRERAERARRERATPWEMREKGREKRTRVMNRNTTALSPFIIPAIAITMAAIGIGDPKPVPASRRRNWD